MGTLQSDGKRLGIWETQKRGEGCLRCPFMSNPQEPLDGKLWLQEIQKV